MHILVKGSVGWSNGVKRNVRVAKVFGARRVIAGASNFHGQ